MSRRRKRYRKPYFKKRRPWYSARNMAGYGGAALTALKIAKEVKSMLNVEYKKKDTASGASNATTTADLYCLNDTEHGDTNEQRDGDDLKAKSCYLRLTCTHNTSGVDEQFVRIIIMIVKQARHAAPTIADILKDPTDFRSLKNYDLRKRYIFLVDKTLTLMAGGTSAHNWEWYKRFNMNVQYEDNNVIPETHAIYAIVIGNQATNGTDYQIDARFKFIDN